jgi:light-regulated signal transduction histidine kinase (bacteriophytochrome)
MALLTIALGAATAAMVSIYIYAAPSRNMLSAGLPVVVVAVVELLMGIVTAAVFVRTLVTPLHRMTAAAVSLAAGSRDVDIASLAARNDEIGDLARAVAVMVREISEREEKLTAQTAELTRSNQELAQFAYVASHDLQEPLRMVGSYLELLSRRYEGKLDNEAQEFIGFAVDGATRMKHLINDLLGYSRAGSNPLKLETVDIGEVLGPVLNTLALHIAETHADVEVGPMPKLTGDALQLGRVFQNLVENALKYRSAAPPRIRIAAEPASVGWRFSVTDNGIGIDPRFREQIFEIFKRLHGREHYSGTGIGLAVTKLVVERHGGRIWVEPAEGGGSIFLFTLPDARMG